MTINKIIEKVKNISEMICESPNNEIITNGKIRGKRELINQILPDLEAAQQTQNELINELSKYFDEKTFINIIALLIKDGK